MLHSLPPIVVVGLVSVCVVDAVDVACENEKSVKRIAIIILLEQLRIMLLQLQSAV